MIRAPHQFPCTTYLALKDILGQLSGILVYQWHIKVVTIRSNFEIQVEYNHLKECDFCMSDFLFLCSIDSVIFVICYDTDLQKADEDNIAKLVLKNAVSIYIISIFNYCHIVLTPAIARISRGG
jgi:hypothetical protein